MPENVLFCSRCGAQNVPSATVCQKCGSGLAQIVPVANAVAVPAAVAAAPAVAYAPPPVVASGLAYGGFWLRVVATLLDGVVLSAVTTPIILLVMFPALKRAIDEAQRGSQDPPVELFARVFAVIPLIWLINWLYECLMTCSSWQGTIGKRVLRLKVIDPAGNRVSFGRATGRSLSKLFLSGIMYVGYIMVAFTDRNQGLHDMIAGTFVVRY
jgi:uncharacterized RDD family membrane protein YckC